MKQFSLILFLVLSFLGCNKKPPSASSFSFHLFMEPQHLDPARSRASTASYFFYNTLRGLYKINARNQPEEEGGICRWKNGKTLVCDLKSEFWSNGDPVTSEDYLRSFQKLVNPATGSPRADLLSQVEGAREISLSQWPPEKLGIEAKNSKQLVFNFVKQDHEFLYKLASTALYPTHKNHDPNKNAFLDFIVNGPYLVAEWNPGKQMILKPNPYYKRGHPQRPLLQIHFIDDELTAFRLYEKKQLSFLRRIPSQLINSLKAREDFYQQPMLRFDYIGFGARIMDLPNLRAALVRSIDYEKLKTLLGALERPGCPSLPKQWLTEQHCHNFDLAEAKQYLKKVPKDKLQRSFQLKVSQLGGNDIKKQAEFFQNQWKTHLGLNIQINQIEQKTLLNELRSDPPDIFRKGVGLDRPTCLDALETFSTDSQQNFIKLSNQSYMEWIKKMRDLQVESPAYRNLCQKANDFLLNQNLVIPLGEMHFTLMASKDFAGWTLNGLNQLDLSQVHPD